MKPKKKAVRMPCPNETECFNCHKGRTKSVSGKKTGDSLLHSERCYECRHIFCYDCINALQVTSAMKLGDAIRDICDSCKKLHGYLHLKDEYIYSEKEKKAIFADKLAKGVKCYGADGKLMT